MTRSLALLFCGVALASCSGSGDLMRTAVPTVPLQFESEPAGAEVKTSGGQTCKTPCALAVPAADMQVTYNLNGYQPQTIPVKLVPPEPGDFGSPPRFNPSPVTAELTKARRAPPKKAPAKVAKRPAAPASADVEPGDGAGGGGGGFAPPPQTSGFNPPPQQPSGGGFPPPGQQQRSSAPPPPAAGGAWPSPSQSR